MELHNLGTALAPLTRGRTTLIVTDSNIAPLYLQRAVTALSQSGFVTHTYILPPGEETKTPENYLSLIHFMASIPLTRSDCAIALGGGVIGDLTGFSAATYLRGIDVVQVPTTLLAAVDSSIGGKTGVNLPAGKNLLGAFHQPLLIWQDDTLLDTLPAPVFLDGMGEVIKYAMLGDSALFETLCQKDAMTTHRQQIVSRCGQMKKDIVAQDELDKGQRQLLNFGHTIGHAIEKASDFTLGHGRAVALGMDMITKISVEKNWCDKSTYTRLHNLLALYGFNLNLQSLFPNVDAASLKAKLLHYISSDKKRKGAVIDLVVPLRIGHCILKQLPLRDLEDLL